ncbi:tripartite tricarboxylate transporter TctB family protein [Oscillibacter sp. MSJ-2]|uniref:Tripartite tricarboxylate transporter TctB family protein n=1 Tax=Dysosmobacter acutus TaxID=2841504 RepID=A0ABS6F5T2_9FIRM|nr:tripartite tricarboxylate transporter TctB family protein [Dysosmobacter acutus]MBU5625652.1 tripartite tricarboxylate transporter TctB family protein [Dysosmobacter acutus]
MFRIKTKTGQVEISKEIIVVLLMDVFAAAYAVAARGLSSASLMFPGFLLAGILIFSIMCIKQSIHFRREAPAEADGEEIGFGITGKLVAFVLLVLATLLCFNFLGAVLCIFLFLLASMVILGVRSKLLLVLIPVVMDTFVYLVFKVWLAVPLPAGLLTFLK